MDCDVAVLGGGPGGYSAAIRAAQLGAKVVCIEKEPELGGTCLRVGCIPTKAWVQTAHFLNQGRESFEKLGVIVSEPELDFPGANEWKGAVVKQMTGGIATLFKANGVEWVKGMGTFKDANTIAVEGGEDVTSTRRSSRRARSRSGRRSTGSTPISASTRPGCSRRPRFRAPGRARRRDHRLRVRLDLPDVRQRGDGDRDARPPDRAGGRRRRARSSASSSASAASRCSSASSARRSSRTAAR